MRRALTLLAALTMAGVLIEASGEEQARTDRTVAPEPTVNAQAAAMQEFQRTLLDYLKLREALSNKLKPLSQTADSAELTTQQESLAAAMKSARKLAKPGDLIPAAVAAQIVAAVSADFRRRKPEATKAALQEVPNVPRPVINRTYPADAALPTVPPLLLGNLPKLPDNLQYRFYGRHIVVLDGDLQIIVDYVANALPPH